MLRAYQIHGGFKRKYGYVGDLIDASVIEATPDALFPKGSKVKAVIVRTRFAIRRPDGTRIKFDDNAAVILSAEGGKDPAGTRVFGPIAREVKEKGYMKISSLSEEVV